VGALAKASASRHLERFRVSAPSRCAASPHPRLPSAHRCSVPGRCALLRPRPRRCPQAANRSRCGRSRSELAPSTVMLQLEVASSDPIPSTLMLQWRLERYSACTWRSAHGNGGMPASAVPAASWLISTGTSNSVLILASLLTDLMNVLPFSTDSMWVM